MTRTTAWLLAAALPLLPLAAPVPAVSAQMATVTKNVNLRADPSTQHDSIRMLHPSEPPMTLLSSHQQSGYYHVRTTASEVGWVFHNRVAIDTTGPTATTTTTTTAQDQIDPAWDKPALVSSTIKVQSGSVSCGADGDGGDTGTDERKNRADTIATGHLVTVAAIRRLNDTLLWRKNNSRDQWTHAESLAVLKYEGIPLTVEGYFEIVKPQKTSAPTNGKKVGEATNCHSWAELDTDWHVALVASPSETEEQAVVIEPTPRTKRLHPGWTTAKAESLAVRHFPSDTRHEAGAARIRVTGFLMFDPVHVNHIRGGCAKINCSGTSFYRATLWELHPVTRIEVQQNGTWVDLSSVN